MDKDTLLCERMKVVIQHYDKIIHHYDNICDYIMSQVPVSLSASEYFPNVEPFFTLMSTRALKKLMFYCKYDSSSLGLKSHEDKASMLIDSAIDPLNLCIIDNRFKYMNTNNIRDVEFRYVIQYEYSKLLTHSKWFLREIEKVSSLIFEE